MEYREPMRGPRETMGASASSANNGLSKKRLVYFSDDCRICMENFNDTEGPVVTTKCGHLFHDYCLEEWRARSGSNKCPSCNTLDSFFGTVTY